MTPPHEYYWSTRLIDSFDLMRRHRPNKYSRKTCHNYILLLQALESFLVDIPTLILTKLTFRYCCYWTWTTCSLRLQAYVKKMGKCSFNDLWLMNSDYKGWLAPCQDKHRAKCLFCKKEFDVGNMGEAALKSHAAGKKHKLRVLSQINQTISVKDYFNPS